MYVARQRPPATVPPTAAFGSPGTADAEAELSSADFSRAAFALSMPALPAPPPPKDGAAKADETSGAVPLMKECARRTMSHKWRLRHVFQGKQAA